MLVLMGGGNVIEGEVARHIERGAKSAARQNARETVAILFLGANDQRWCAAACRCRILDQGDQKRVRRALAKTACENGQRIVTKGTCRRAQKLRVFGIAADALG